MTPSSLRVARLYLAEVFPTQDALDAYMKEHPGADRHNHSVAPKDQGPSSKAKGKHPSPEVNDFLGQETKTKFEVEEGKPSFGGGGSSTHHIRFELSPEQKSKLKALAKKHADQLDDEGEFGDLIKHMADTGEGIVYLNAKGDMMDPDGTKDKHVTTFKNPDDMFSHYADDAISALKSFKAPSKLETWGRHWFLTASSRIAQQYLDSSDRT